MSKLYLILYIIISLINVGLSYGQPLSPIKDSIIPSLEILMDKNISPQSSSEFIVQLTDESVWQKLKKSNIIILRKLDAKHFLVKSENYQSLTESDIIREIVPANDYRKLSQNLIFKRIASLDNFENKKENYTVTVDNGNKFLKILAERKNNIQIISFNKEAGILDISCETSYLYDSILPLREVLYIEEPSALPQPESTIKDGDLSINKINMVHHLWPQLDGNSSLVSIKEQGININDIDLAGRNIPSGIENPASSIHATEMATIIAGAGNSSEESKGVAWKANYSSSDYNQLFPDNISYFDTQKIYVQNHSYGTTIENFYGGLARAYDMHCHNNDNLVHVFSAGNAGLSKDSVGIYKNIEGMANLTGNFKMAKNIITVGAVDSVANYDPLVSHGPAYDGRIKPELVAYGSGGSSNAAALVSGTVVLLQQAYFNIYQQHPPSALIKAILLNTAEDIATPGPDYLTGFGNMNAEKAVHTIMENRFKGGKIAENEIISFPVSLPANAKSLKVTLVWNDPPALPEAWQALVNDLDLQVRNVTGKVFLPLVLNTYPERDSLLKPATADIDRLNNVEQIYISDAVEGKYIVEITGFNVQEGLQDFYIAYQWELEDDFKWTYPSGTDKYSNFGDRNVFRWNTNYSPEHGKLEISLDQGNTWQAVGVNVNLGKEHYKWTAPEIFSIALAKMTIGEKVYISDAFTISHPLAASVGFNCEDSIMLIWGAAPDIDNYSVYSMQGNYLEEIANTSDTFFIFKKQDYSTSYFSIAPKLANFEGIRQTTFDYTRQGTACFISSFTAQLQTDNSVIVNLDLGTTRYVEEIIIERWMKDAFVPITVISQTPELNISYIDTSPLRGYNLYRATLRLSNGETVLTDPAEVYYLTPLDILVFPNPAERSISLKIYSGNPEEEADFELRSASGQLVIKQQMESDRAEVKIDDLQPGLYLYIIRTRNSKHTGKLIVTR